ncbi:MAG: hypothetical protein E7266_10845 [Lachnospiraceae bacterium]|nr:hypothetical protein [Lachnospiraceae bacterium]
MRKPLERNEKLQLVNSSEISERAKEITEQFFDEFPEVDCNDLMRILMLEGNLQGMLKNIKDNNAYEN